ncbi:DUF488 family protein [Sporolituus thermophilus]|uniref:DUF488 domain-containing protein n=1 Tax=Sporolituus thermophilus DSM 23256 TaxID=1123285 RepID=A0A1G7MJI9_9FIRM|nr:DUF488 domain-containing protein [Sporolituus thermophilus]SDF62048.1 Protein of unknown function, DUF488 [Sporolituus thermophilus DSM 23256]
MAEGTLYTIGFSQKSARQFFGLLMDNGVKRLIDIRLNNNSQLAGFTKMPDLEYFLKEIADIEYIYLPEFAPTKTIMDDYKNKKINWREYEKQYLALLVERQPLAKLDAAIFNDSCLLCAEASAQYCHRRLAAEYITRMVTGLSIVHLGQA